MKSCTKCKQEKLLDEFAKKGNGKQPWCRSCNAARSKQYYAENKEHHVKVIIERNRLVKKQTQEKLCQFLREHPCTDCGESDIVVLEFDHLRDKTANVANLVGSGWSRLYEEILKCEVVCANCHRRRTAKRTPNYCCV